MTDEEIGISAGSIPWDGVIGPRVINEDGDQRIVEYPDYPHAALDGLFSIAQTSRVTLAEYKRRIIAMLRCYSALPQGNRTSTHILSVREVSFSNSDLDQAQQQGNATLTGPVYRFEVFTDEVTFSGGQTQDNVSPPEMRENNHKARYTVGISWVVLVGTGQFVLLRWKQGDGSVQRGNWFRRDV